MYDHIGLKVGNLDASVRFYTAALAPLGYVLCSRDASGAGFGPKGEPALWLYLDKGFSGAGAHIAFRAPDHAAIQKFHAEGVKAGGRDNGTAGPRADYSPTYFAAFLIDPDGNNVEAVCTQAHRSTHTAVIPGRCEASNSDVQLHIGESRDSPMRNCASEVWCYAPSRNDGDQYRGSFHMASIHKNIPIDAHPNDVWAAVRDFGAVHRRLTPGFVLDAQLDGDARVVTFANGTVARELLVDCDDAWRRLVYAVISERVKQHSASVQIIPDGDARTRLVWIVDVLPNDIAPYIDAQMDQAALAMQKALGRNAT